MSHNSLIHLALKAKSLLDQGNKEEALDVLFLARDIPTDSAEHHYFLGTLFALAGSDSDAVNQFKEAVSLNESHAEAHAALGSHYLTESRNDLAIAYLERAKQLGAQYPSLRAALASALMNVDRYGDAKDALDGVPEKERNGSYYWLQLMRLRSVQGHYADVISLATKILGDCPHDVNAHVYLADAHLENGNLVEGRESLKNAVQQGPENAWQISNGALLAYLLDEVSIGADMVSLLELRFAQDAIQLKAKLRDLGLKA